MNNIQNNLFKAIFENKWLYIEYQNKNNEITKYWIGIKDISIGKNIVLNVEGLHVSKLTFASLNIMYDSIISSTILDSSYFEVDQSLKDDISNNPNKYERLFYKISNLKILNYLRDCHRLDSTPYKSEYTTLAHFDQDLFTDDCYFLNDNQFKQIVTDFQILAKDNKTVKAYKQLAVNVLSVHTKDGLYVLGYKQLKFDVVNKRLIKDNNIIVCEEMSINNTTQSIRRFLDAEDYELLEDFAANQKQITDKVMNNIPEYYKVDDRPYIMAIERNIIVDLENEYAAIEEMYRNQQATIPIKAFFGELTKAPVSKKSCPIALINNKVNLDQLLAISNATKNPLTYVQGPPGTGKTNTILNLILTEYFNGKTVLFTSYNNHPIDSVVERLSNIKYKDRTIPLPILRVGNYEKNIAALDYIKELYQSVKDIEFKEEALTRREETLKENAKELTSLMNRYEDYLELIERKDALEKLVDSTIDFNFSLSLQSKQLSEIDDKIKKIGKITDDDALKLVVNDEEFKQFLYFNSVKKISELGNKKYAKLMELVYQEDNEEKSKNLNTYLSNDVNLADLLKVFPIICTTCLSAHNIGTAKTHFDLTIIDEASQCNNAVSLIPILRSANLLLVGDPQQLNPVIVLDSKTNTLLKEKYEINEEYDYINNSIYKLFLATDSISNEILLSHHYRCDGNIINFCNRKYYNNKLKIDKKSTSANPLVYVNVKNSESSIKNCSPMEADAIVDYLKKHQDKNIGIITPFVNQKKYLTELIKNNGLINVSCGTVHAFQGDEKDVIIFSLALTNKTHQASYNWLKNNKELINVAVSRARESLIIFADDAIVNKLHNNDLNSRDDLYELCQYVKSNGTSKVIPVESKSRALGIKPYSTETETEFLDSLNMVLENIAKQSSKCVVHKEVAISQVFNDNIPYSDLFYTGRFDFVVFEKRLNAEIPILAIELDGKEHKSLESVKLRDEKKNKICKDHGFNLIRVENCYARRYNHLKEILIDYFKS